MAHREGFIKSKACSPLSVCSPYPPHKAILTLHDLLRAPGADLQRLPQTLFALAFSWSSGDRGSRIFFSLAPPLARRSWQWPRSSMASAPDGGPSSGEPIFIRFLCTVPFPHCLRPPGSNSFLLVLIPGCLTMLCWFP